MFEIDNLRVNFNRENYIAKYNTQTGFFEIDINAPEIGGMYEAEVIYKDFAEQISKESKYIQILAKEKLKIETDYVFMWIFDYKDLTVKDILELSEYTINIDEQTNGKSTIKANRNRNVKKKDIVYIKKIMKVFFGEL